MTTLYSLGAMTGTSCDGVDFSLLQLRPSEPDPLKRERHLNHTSFSFPTVLRQRLLNAQTGRLNIQQTAVLSRDFSNWLGRRASEVLNASRGTPRARTIVAAHGQTVWHQPQESVSVQLLDPFRIAVATGCTVVSNFRAPDLAAGGEGAPLVPSYHWVIGQALLGGRPEISIHNIGGISNFTIVSRRPSRVIAFDTGPGNCLIDLAVSIYSGGEKKLDHGGKIAARFLDEIQRTKLERLAANTQYFRAPPPKSTGRELFNGAFLKKLPSKSPGERVAAATFFSAHTMALAYRDFVFACGANPREIYVCGGGAKNDTLRSLFQFELHRLTERRVRVSSLPMAQGSPEYVEATAFARFGYEALLGHPIALPAVTGARVGAVGAAIAPGANYRSILKYLHEILKHQR